MAGSGGIGGNPIVGATPCPVCDLQSHAATGWCLAATGEPVIIITTINCVNGIVQPPFVQFVDPATGDELPLAAIVPCGDKDWEVNQLCDFNPATGDLIATFTQIFEWDEDQGTLTVTLVRADDPTVPYVPVGQVRACIEREPAIQIQWEQLCDKPAGAVDAIPFLRRYLYDDYTNVTTVTDFTMDAITPYVPIGTIQRCTEDTEWLVLCDDPDGSAKPIPFLRRIITNPYTGLNIVDDFELDGTTPYVTTGEVRDCVAALTPPADAPGKDYFDAALAAQTVDGAVYTVPVGKVAHVTSFILTAINADLANTLQLNIRDGAAGPIKIPITAGDAATGASSSASIGAPSFLQPMRFFTSIYADEVMGDLTWSIAVVGYLEDI